IPGSVMKCWRPTRRIPSTSSRNRGWGTGSRREGRRFERRGRGYEAVSAPRYASDMSAVPRSEKPVGRFRRMLDRLSSSQEDLESEELREDTATAGCTRIGDCHDRQVVTVTGTLRTVTLRPRAG